jgi:hypothetical protein
VSHRKRSWMELPQTAETAPVPDRGLTQAQILQLRSAHDPVLAVSQLGYRSLGFASP